MLANYNWYIGRSVGNATQRAGDARALPQSWLGHRASQGIAREISKGRCTGDNSSPQRARCGAAEKVLKETGGIRDKPRRPALTYHFRIHTKDGLWAECVELEGCITQGKNLSALRKNMKEALDLYLDEPESSKIVFPPPASKVSGPGIAFVEVDPGVAFAMQLRQARITSRMTQKEAAQRLGMRSLYSYQRLERRSNPSLATIKKVKKLFPTLSLDAIL